MGLRARGGGSGRLSLREPVLGTISARLNSAANHFRIGRSLKNLLQLIQLGSDINQLGSFVRVRAA